VRFSVGLPLERVDRAEELLTAEAVGELARSAEDAGFDACFVTDHPMPEDRWLARGGHHALDPFVALSFAAAATTQLRLLTLVLVLGYRNPFLAAKAAASLDVLSGGRLVLGVAAGYLRGEFEALGADFEHRNAVADETLDAMKRAFAGESVALSGRSFRAAGNTALPRPRQRPHPPIWVGGNSLRAIRRAVERGDGWLPFPAPRRLAGAVRTSPLETRDDLRALLGTAREHARKVGRTAPLEVCFVPFEYAATAREEPDPARFRETVAELEAEGVTWLALNLPADTRAAFRERVERFGTDVIARLPRRAGA